MRATITKWSDKVLSASGLALSSSKKFKAINQNTIHSIDHSLAPSERERLIKRTRTKRSFAPVLGAKEEEGMGRGGLEGEEFEEKGDVECFDDGDFYQQILREVVESRMLDLGTFISSLCSSSFTLSSSSTAYSSTGWTRR